MWLTLISSPHSDVKESCPPKCKCCTVVTRNVFSIDKTVFSKDMKKKACNEVNSLIPDSTVDQLVNGYNTRVKGSTPTSASSFCSFCA